MEISPRIGKPELQLMNFWRLSVDQSELKTEWGLSQWAAEHFCEFYLQKLYQRLTVSIREKFFHAPSREREQETY